MRTLSATLLAAQQSASAQPYLRVQLSDAELSTVRLRWTRWYSGGEADGPCGAAVPADGSLLRARIVPGTGALSHQRVATPGAGSDYSQWTSLGTVAAGPRLGLGAAGTRALLATVRTDGVSVEVRESTDSGASFGGAAVVATAGGTVTAVACALQADGSAAVLYAVAGVVRSVQRTGTGSWGSPQAWSQSLATVSGLAARFGVDYDVLVSGTDAAGDAGAWATALGTGGNFPPGAWAALTAVALASGGTGVTYLATGAAEPGAPRAAFVESYSGGGGYSRVHTASGVALTSWADFAWRDPRPFDHASAYGLGMAGSASAAWLCAPHGVWHAGVTLTVTDLTADVLEAHLEQGLEPGRLRLVLRNDGGRYDAGAAPAALVAGGEIAMSPGYVTTAGAESSSGPRFWITSVARRRRGGVATVELLAEDGWGLLDGWRAPRQLVWRGQSAAAVLADLTRRVGLRLGTGRASAESTTLQPDVTVRAGERASTAVRRLLAMLPDVLVVEGVFAELVEPAADDATDYDAYGAAHAVLELRAEQGPPAAGWARVFGNGVFAEAVDEAVLRDGGGAAIAVDDNLAAQARADARAAAVLRQSALAAPQGELLARPHAGQQAGDVIAVTDQALGTGMHRYRVRALRLVLARGARARYEMTLALTAV